MKIVIHLDENIENEEIIIKCQKLTDEVKEIQRLISRILSKKEKIIFYKNDSEYYISLEEILFFETEGDKIFGHSKDDIYEIKYRLYELEKILPRNFIRVSKSTILNVDPVKSVDRNITASSTVSFRGSHKQTYVSRYYYKNFRARLMEIRGYEEK